MKLWGEFKEKLLNNRLRLVLASLLMVPLVLSFVVIYQKDNTEEVYADTVLINASELPLNANVTMGSFIADGRLWTVNWQVLANDDIDGDGVNDPLLITQKSPMYKKEESNGQMKHDVEYYLKNSTTVNEIPGQYKGTLNRYATTANRASFNNFKKKTEFFGGNGFNFKLGKIPYSTSILEDYEWNAIKISKNKTVVTQKQADMFAYDGGNAIYVEPGTTDYSDFGNYQNAYFEYTYDKIFEAGFPEMHLAYIASGNSLNDWRASYKNFNVDTRYDTCYWREPRINVTNAFHGFLKTSDGKGGYWNNSISANTNDSAFRWCCYLDGNAQIIQNGSSYKVSPDTTTSEINYATSITCYPDDMKTPTTLDGMNLVGRIDNMGNALITERGWYIGQNENNFLDDSVVKVTVDGDNETISNKAIKIEYTGSIRISDSYEQFVDFSSLIPNYQAGDPVWIRSYVKSKLSPSGNEVTRFGVKMRVEPKTWTTPTTFNDKVLTGLEHPSKLIGTPMANNVLDSSHEWTSTIKWGHFDGDEFVEETGNFEDGRDYWAEISLTTSLSYGFSQNDTHVERFSIYNSDFNYFVQNADDVHMDFIPQNSQSIVVYAYFENKTPSKLVPGNTVQMGKFNGHDLTWRVTSLRDLDNDGVDETPLLVLDTYLMEQGSNNPYKKEFSLPGNKGDYPSEARTTNGTNRYAESSLRRWLNSRNGNLTYSNALYYDDEIITDGFLSESNFSDSEFNAIRRTKIKTMTSNYDAVNHSLKGIGTQRHIYDEDMANIYQNYNASWYEDTDDLVFLMGIEDLAYSNATSGNGFNVNLGESYWLRDSKAITDDEIRTVDSSTSVTSSKANSLKAIRPALYLRNDCQLVSIGGGNYKVGTDNEKQIRPATVVTGEIDYSKVDAISTKKTVIASGYIENPDNVQILEVGYITDSSSPQNLDVVTEANGNDYWLLDNKTPTKLKMTKTEKRNMEFDFELGWINGTSTYYYRPYVKSFVNGREYTKFGNLMSYTTYSVSAKNKVINDLIIYGVYREVEGGALSAPVIQSGQWTAGINWYEEDGSGGFSSTPLAYRAYLDQAKTYKAEILLTKKSGYKWGALPENSFKVPGASSVTSMAVTDNYNDSTNKVVVTAIFEPYFYTVGDININDSIYLGGLNGKLSFRLEQWNDIDDDGVAEALFYYNGSGQFMRSPSSDSTEYLVPWGTTFNSSVTTGKAPYNFGSRYDLSYVRKFLNLRVLSTQGEKLTDADRYQNYYYPNNSVTYNDTSLFRGAYSIFDYEYDAIKQTKWKFLLGKHEIEDLKMAEEWDGYKPASFPSTALSSTYLSNFYYPNRKAYYAYSTEKITTASIQELCAKLIRTPSSCSQSRDTSVKKSVWFRDGMGTIDNVLIQDHYNNKYTGLAAKSSANVIPCFYLEPDVIIGNDSNKSNRLGIIPYSKPYEDYAVAITGEPIYSKTPPTDLTKLFLTGDCDNFTKAKIKEKGWYIGYNPSDNMDYSVVDVDTITTTAVKVKYSRDFNRTDGYYEDMIDLTELFPDYNPGDYVWIRSYVKSKCGDLPLKETYGNRIRVKPVDTFAGGSNTIIDDYYITGLKNPANYYGKPIADYEITADESLDWRIQSVEWGTFDGTNFTAKTGNFRQDTEYTALITLAPPPLYQTFPNSVSKNYFCVSGAKSTTNVASSGASVIYVYATFHNIVLQSAPDAPEVTLEKSGTTLTASWTEPDDNGAEITGYIIQLDDEDPVNVSNTTFTKTYTNVANTAHTVKVKAVNEMGESDEGTASVEPCYQMPGDNPISYWEDDIVTYNDNGVTKKADWDISNAGDGTIKAYLFNTKNSSNVQIPGDMTLVISGPGTDILDFAYAYKSSSSFASKGSTEIETFSASGYDFRTKYNGTGYITPWSWIPDLHVKHVIFAEDTAFTNWDMLLCELDELVDVTFDGEDLKAPTSMQGTFRDTSNFQMNFARIDTSNVTSMKRIFKGSFKEDIDLSTWSSAALLNMDEAFATLLGCSSLTFGNEFTASSVTSASKLFKGDSMRGSNLAKIDLSNAVFGNITDMSFWFSDLESLKSVKFGTNFDTSSVSNMQSMFKNDWDLGNEIEGGLTDKTLDLSMFDTKLVTNASSMFEGCANLEKISLGTNGTFEKAVNISSIFKDMSKLTELNLSKLELDSVTDYSDALDGCSVLSKIYLPASIKSGVSIDLPSTGFLPYSQSGNIVSDITDTTHLIPKNLVGASGIEASYVKIATESDLKVNEINNASTDEAIYDIIRSQAFKDLLPDGENKTTYVGSSNDEKKIAANYLYNHIHTSGTHPYSSLEDAFEDILFSITNAEYVTYETLEILPGEKGSYKVPSALVSTNEITASWVEGGTNKSHVVTPGTNYDTIVVDGAVTYTFKKTLKNSTLFTEPITIATITFANHLVLDTGDIVFDGGPFTYNGLAQYVTPRCTKFASCDFVTTYKLKGTSNIIAKSSIIDAGSYICETTLTGPDFIDGIKTASTEFTIEKDTFTDNAGLTIEGYASSVTYKGEAYNNYALTVKLNGEVLDSSNYEITYGENINAGSGTITVSGKKNFTGSKTFTFTISPKDISLDDNIKPDNLNDMEWTGSQLIPPLFDVIDERIMIGTKPKKLNYQTEFNITGYGENKNIGDDNGQVTITGLGNYAGSKTFTFNIVGQIIRDLSKIEVLVDDTQLVFTGSALTPSDKVTVKLNGTQLPSTDFEITGWENNINANASSSSKAKVKVKLKGNYSSDVVEKSFTINPKEVSSTDFTYAGPVITKEVSKKTEYNEQIPNSEKNKIEVKLNAEPQVKLNFTNAKFAGISSSDNPKKFGNAAIELTGLSVNSTNYKLKSDFTSFTIPSSNGLLVDKIKPELDTNWVVITPGTYKAGDEILITLKFDKNIVKSGNDPVLEFWSTNVSDGKIGTLQSNKYIATTEYVSNSNNEVTFKYVVSDGDFIPNGFTFKLSGINNYSSLKDSLGNEIEYVQNEKRIDGVKIVTPDAVFEKLINEIQGNDSNSKKKEVILDILNDPDMSDSIFDDPAAGDLKTKIGSSAGDALLKEFVADYLSNIKLEGTNKKEELFDEMKKAIELKDIENEINTNLDTYPNDKAVIDSQMIKYQKLSPNQKKNFNKTIKEKLDTLYYANLTDDYKYKDNPQGEANEIEMYGIVTRTSAGDAPVKLQVDRISDIERINILQKMVKDNKSSVVDDPSKERIIAPYDIKLVRADDESVTVDIPGEKVLCRIDLPSSYYGKILNIYHKVGIDSLEKVDNKLIQLLNDKTVVYFECDSFSPYFMTSDVVSVKASISDDSESGSVTPIGLFTKNYGQSQTFTLRGEGNSNRVDITLLKFDESSEEFKEVTGLEPINLYKSSNFTLSNITSNMFITFKFSHDDNFKPDEKPEEAPKGTTITIGPGEFKAYMEGYKDGTFRPQNKLTRAEAATIVARISGSFSEKANYKSYATSFKDIDKNGWYLNYIGFVISKGYMCGDSKGFRPNDPITRGEFTKLIYKLEESKMKQVSVTNTFTDVQGKFYQDFSNTLYSAKLIKGYGDGTFKGQNSITRSEACTIINSALGRGTNKEATLKAITKSPNYKTFKDLQSFRWYYIDDMIAAVTYWE